MFVTDFVNLSIILIVVFGSYHLKLIPLWCTVILSVLAATPFTLNGVLFLPSYMPDQFLYLDHVIALRRFELHETFSDMNNQVRTASLLFAVAPLPFVDTLFGLAFVNRLFLTILIIWLYAKKNITDFALLFLLFYPSLLLYSSLALRDMMITAFMVVSIIQFVDRKWISTIIILIPLYLLKPQNAMIMVLFFGVYLTLTRGNVLNDLKYILIPIGAVCSIPLLPLVIGRLDAFRQIMFLQDGQDVDAYISIASLKTFMMQAPLAGPYFLVKPLPMEATGFLQYIQSTENILIVLVIALLLYLASLTQKNLALKWIFFLAISMTIYGLVVFNFGTSVRYKFPFITAFVIGIYYDYYRATGQKITAPILLVLSKYLQGKLYFVKKKL